MGEIDWGALYRRLRLFSFRIAREMPGVFDGVSADDLVGETLTAFLADPHGLGWDPTTQDNLERFLCAVLKHKFMGHRRRNRSREGTADVRLAPLLTTTHPLVETMSERIKAAARGKRDLEELLEAAQYMMGRRSLSVSGYTKGN